MVGAVLLGTSWRNMAGLVNIFLRERYRRLVGLAIWLAITLVLIAVSALVWRAHLKSSLHTEAELSLSRLDKLHANVMTAFGELQRTATQEPCSQPFMRELRRVAFFP